MGAVVMRKCMLLIACLFFVAFSAVKVEALLGLGGLLGPLLGLIRIQGTVFCTLNGNIGVNGTATPVFPNAAVQLQCGSGNVVSTAVTNAQGVFSMVLDPLQTLVTSLLSNCRLVVNTPLASCNATLPSVGGQLSSTLNLIGTSGIGGLVNNVFNLGPSGFQALN